MNKNTVNTKLEILGKPYTIKCDESELAALQEASAFLSERMTEVKDNIQVANLEKIAIITALNLASQYLQLDKQKNNFITRLNQHINYLQTKLDAMINKIMQTEFSYSEE